MPVERKVQAGVLGGAIAIIVTWILVYNGVDVPPEVGAAFATVFGGVLGWVVPSKDQA